MNHLENRTSGFQKMVVGLSDDGSYSQEYDYESQDMLVWEHSLKPLLPC